jgi:hypothetical protein
MKLAVETDVQYSLLRLRYLRRKTVFDVFPTQIEAVTPCGFLWLQNFLIDIS